MYDLLINYSLSELSKYIVTLIKCIVFGKSQNERLVDLPAVLVFFIIQKIRKLDLLENIIHLPANAQPGGDCSLSTSESYRRWSHAASAVCNPVRSLPWQS